MHRAPADATDWPDLCGPASFSCHEPMCDDALVTHTVGQFGFTPPSTERDKVLSKSREREYHSLMAVSSPDLKAFLVATPFFGGLSDASLDLLVSMLVERRFDAGATVVAEGEPGRSMFVVQSGALVASKLGNSGRVVRMAGLEPGDFFGEMTLIEMQNRSATVVAETPTVLYELTARNLYACYKADITAYVMVLQNINRELCRRLRRADDRIAELADASRESMTPIPASHTS
jgi:CRP/FNR family transcriptional regulator, cyclic AMP receptor protein